MWPKLFTKFTTRGPRTFLIFDVTLTLDSDRRQLIFHVFSFPLIVPVLNFVKFFQSSPLKAGSRP